MLALPGFASSQEVEALRQRGLEIVRAFDPKQISVFTTEGNKQVGLNDLQPAPTDAHKKGLVPCRRC